MASVHALVKVTSSVEAVSCVACRAVWLAGCWASPEDTHKRTARDTTTSCFTGASKLADSRNLPPCAQSHNKEFGTMQALQGRNNDDHGRKKVNQTAVCRCPIFRVLCERWDSTTLNAS